MVLAWHGAGVKQGIQQRPLAVALGQPNEGLQRGLQEAAVDATTAHWLAKLTPLVMEPESSALRASRPAFSTSVMSPRPWDRLDAVLPEGHEAREEREALDDARVHVGVLVDALGSRHGAQARLPEAGSSVGHGEGRRAASGLGLHDLGPGVLDAGRQGGRGLVRELGEHRGLGLREEGQDGDACVASDDGHRDELGVDAADLRDKLVGADDVEGGDAKQLLGVVLAWRRTITGQSHRNRVS